MDTDTVNPAQTGARAEAMIASVRTRSVISWQLAVIVGCFGLALFSFATTAGEIYATRQPRLALQLAPWNADAKAQLAMTMISDNQRSNPLVARLASQSLARKPANAAALRVLALVKNDTASTARLFALSERMSRRDSLTQLALIEVDVAAGNVPSILKHYDRVMRVKPELSNMLIPILVSASADLDVRREVARRLRDRPMWWGNYLAALGRSGSSPAALESAAMAVGLKPDVASESAALSAVLFRLAALGAWPEMRRVYRTYCATQCSSLVRNGDFEREPTLMPLDWILSSDPTASAIVPTGDGKGSELEMQGHGIDRGARQMLLLSPGSYILSIKIDGSPNPRLAPTVEIACTQGKEVAAGAAIVGPIFRNRFTVPAGCEAQWLSFQSSDEDQDPDNPVHLDNVEIRRMPALQAERHI